MQNTLSILSMVSRNVMRSGIVVNIYVMMYALHLYSCAIYVKVILYEYYSNLLLVIYCFVCKLPRQVDFKFE